MIDYEIDWDTAVAYPKLDGRLAVLYYYGGGMCSLSHAAVNVVIRGWSICTNYILEVWHVSSSLTPDGSDLVSMTTRGGQLQTSTAFRDLFWSLWTQLRYQLPDATHTDASAADVVGSDRGQHCCYMFEVLSPKCRNIVFYEKVCSSWG